MLWWVKWGCHLLLLGFPLCLHWHPGGKGLLHTAGWGGISGFPYGCHWQLWVGVFLLPLNTGKNSDSPLGFLWQTLKGERVWSTLSQPAKGACLGSPFGFCWQKWGVGCSSFLCCLAGVDLVLSKSFCISRQLFPWSFGKRGQTFLWASSPSFLPSVRLSFLLSFFPAVFLFFPLCLWSWSASSPVSSLEYVKQKEAPENLPPMFFQPKVPSGTAFL